jgi:tryptophan synthase alpha chain
MSRIHQHFAGLRSTGRRALTLFVTAGFPERNSLPLLAPRLEAAGADFLEIGMPFSDPLADGPVIQASSHRALLNGMTLDRLLQQVRSVRRSTGFPLILMGYLNPIVAFGLERFFDRAAEAGVDGIILPELPLEETGRVAPLLRARAIDQILLVTPTSDDDRIRKTDEACSGFLYCVSTTGVTGEGAHSSLAEYFRRVRRAVRRNPVQVGFGIQTPGDARRMAQHADGVIIGTALLRAIEHEGTGKRLQEWVAGFRRGLSSPPSARHGASLRTRLPRP